MPEKKATRKLMTIYDEITDALSDFKQDMVLIESGERGAGAAGLRARKALAKIKPLLAEAKQRTLDLKS